MNKPNQTCCARGPAPALAHAALGTFHAQIRSAEIRPGAFLDHDLEQGRAAGGAKLGYFSRQVFSLLDAPGFQITTPLYDLGE